MRPKAFLKTVLTLMALTTCLLSCQKKKSDPTRHDMLLGKWMNTENGADGNSNGSWDAAEHTAIPSASAVTIRFNSDGTGAETGIVGGTPVSSPISWELQNSDNDLVITSSYTGTPETYTRHIMSFSDANMTTSDRRTGGLEFDAFAKQN